MVDFFIFFLCFLPDLKGKWFQQFDYFWWNGLNLPPTSYKPPNREFWIEICSFQAHLRWSVFFWLLPWGKHILQVYCTPERKDASKGGNQFLALSPMPAEPHKWIKSFRTQLFVVQKCYFSACVRFPQKTFHTADGGRDAKKNGTVLDPTTWRWFHGCCVGEWCWWPWRRSVTKVSLWVAGEKGWGFGVCLKPMLHSHSGNLT